jgi:isopenicillin N synthase-like dioxygenase
MMTDLAVCDFRLCASPSSSERTQFAEQFGRSIRDHGFAILSEHTVDAEQLRGAFSICAALFALPTESKRRYSVPESRGNRGYVGFGVERALGASVGDLKEFWHFGQPKPSPASTLLANVWPTEREVQHAQEHLTQLFIAYETLASQLLQSLAAYLDQPHNWLSSMIEGGDSILRLIHYPPIADDAPSGAIRAAAHEDINLITLLAEGTSGGLELLTRNGEWVAVQSLRGQLVINAGDMLQRVTNGRLRSTTHRVVNPEQSHTARYSMPFFTHPRPEVLLNPLPAEPGSEDKTPPTITAGEYLQQRLNAITLPKTP